MKILGISGRKQSGKGVTSNFILGMHLLNNGVIRGNFQIMPDGQLWVSDIYGEDNTAGIFNQACRSDEMYNWFTENVYPLVKIYNFATPLKQLCIEILGLTHEQCYGTDEQKNSKTKLKWEDVPKFRVTKRTPLKTGFMSGREVLQYVGTDIFRTMYSDVWVDATIRQIQIEQPTIAIIADARFPNEIEGIKAAGGKVVRLTRAPFKDDQHTSEVALDQENFDWTVFDVVVDNSQMTIEQQNEEIYKILQPWGYLPEVN